MCGFAMGGTGGLSFSTFPLLSALLSLAHVMSQISLSVFPPSRRVTFALAVLLSAGGVPVPLGASPLHRGAGGVRQGGEVR